MSDSTFQRERASLLRLLLLMTVTEDLPLTMMMKTIMAMMVVEEEQEEPVQANSREAIISLEASLPLPLLPPTEVVPGSVSWQTIHHFTPRLKSLR